MREAYKRRGEEYQLFWPEKSGARVVLGFLHCCPAGEQFGCACWKRMACSAPIAAPGLSQQLGCNAPSALLRSIRHALSPPLHVAAEFIRMAARFGATIVPFAAVGVDDSLNIVADSQQLEALPVLGDMVKRRAGGLPQVGSGWWLLPTCRRGCAGGRRLRPVLALVWLAYLSCSAACAFTVEMLTHQPPLVPRPPKHRRGKAWLQHPLRRRALWRRWPRPSCLQDGCTSSSNVRLRLRLHSAWACNGCTRAGCLDGASAAPRLWPGAAANPALDGS